MPNYNNLFVLVVYLPRQGLFYLNDFQNAHSAFTKATSLGKDCEMWLRKCNAELATIPSTNITSSVTPIVATPVVIQSSTNKDIAPQTEVVVPVIPQTIADKIKYSLLSFSNFVIHYARVISVNYISPF